MPFLKLGFCLVGLLTSTALAQSGFQKVGTCGKAQVVSGHTCSNVKVQFDLSACGDFTEPLMADRIRCQGQEITARVTREGQRFEAQYRKTTDGWGAIQWTSMGEVAKLEKAAVAASPQKAAGRQKQAFVPSTAHSTAPATHAHLASSPAPAPVIGSPVTRAPAATDPGAAGAPSAVIEAAAPPATLRVSSFFDFRHSTSDTDETDLKKKEINGFLLEDGAIYLGVQRAKLSILVDLPFSRNRDEGSALADLAFVKTKAQLVARYQVLEGLTFGFGQFDTFFGVEVNDSKDRLFGNVGMVYAQTLPVVHNGAFLEYAANGWTGRLMSANAADRETLGTIEGDSYHEGAVTIGYASDFLRGQIGYLARPKKDLTGSASSRSLADAILGLTYGPIDLDFEYSMVQDPTKNTLAPQEALDKESAGTGSMVLAAFRLSEALKFGARYEVIDKDPGATDSFKATAWGLNGAYKIDELFTSRIEYTTSESEKFIGTKSTDHRLDVGAVVSF